MTAAWRHCLAALALAACSVATHAADPVRLERTAGSTALVNDLPVPVVVSIQTTSKGLRPSFVVEVVPPRRRMAISSGSTASRLVQSTPAHARLAISAPAGCERSRPELGGVLAEGAEQLRRLEISNTADAVAAASASGRAAGLELANWVAYESYLRDNPHRQDTLEKLGETDPVLTAQIHQADEFNKSMTAMLALAGESGARMAEQERQWAREATLMRPLLDGLKQAENQMKLDIESARALEQAGRDHARVVLEALRLEPPVSVPVSVERTCREPARNQDQVVLRGAQGAAARGAIVVHLRFSDGTRATYPAFPVSGRNDSWILVFYWPPKADGVAFSVQGRSGDAKVGGVTAGRRAAAVTFAQLTKLRKDAQHKLQEAKWLGDGGSGVSSGTAIY